MSTEPTAYDMGIEEQYHNVCSWDLIAQCTNQKNLEDWAWFADSHSPDDYVFGLNSRYPGGLVAGFAPSNLSSAIWDIALANLPLAFKTVEEKYAVIAAAFDSVVQVDLHHEHSSFIDFYAVCDKRRQQAMEQADIVGFSAYGLEVKTLSNAAAICMRMSERKLKKIPWKDVVNLLANDEGMESYVRFIAKIDSKLYSVCEWVLDNGGYLFISNGLDDFGPPIIYADALRCLHCLVDDRFDDRALKSLCSSKTAQLWAFARSKEIYKQRMRDFSVSEGVRIYDAASQAPQDGEQRSI